jgi:hypothetical protein
MIERHVPRPPAGSCVRTAAGSTPGGRGNLTSWRISVQTVGMKRWPRTSEGAGSNSQLTRLSGVRCGYKLASLVATDFFY